jgi:hypothetical protein
VTRTVGAAIGAVIFVLFFATIATRFTRPVSAESITQHPRAAQR